MNPSSLYSGIDNLEIMREAKNYNAYLLSRIDCEIRPSNRVLDFGAGDGAFALMLLNRGDSICAVEPDHSLRLRLKRLCIPAYQSLDEIEDESINFIYSLNVLEHIEDDAAVVQTLAKKLAPHGRILIYVPAFNILYTSMDRKVGHQRRYRRNELVKLLGLAELQVHKAHYVDSLGFFATLMYRIVGSERGDLNGSLLRFYDRWIFPISQLLDRFTSKLFGKNLLIVAFRKS